MQDQSLMSVKILNKHAPTAEAHLHGTTFLPVSKPKPVFKKTCIFMAPSQKMHISSWKCSSYKQHFACTEFLASPWELCAYCWGNRAFLAAKANSLHFFESFVPGCEGKKINLFSCIRLLASFCVLCSCCLQKPENLNLSG